MDGINLAVIVEIITRYGLTGILAIFWWSERKENKESKTQITIILQQYKQDMVEMRKMYESNVTLVKGYQSVAGDLKEVVIMNTQAMTELCLDVRTNQYCPNVRLEKQAKGVQG